MGFMSISLLGILGPLGEVHDGCTVLGQVGGEGPVALGGIGLGPLQEVGRGVGVGQTVFDDLPAHHDGGQKVLIAHDSSSFFTKAYNMNSNYNVARSRPGGKLHFRLYHAHL